MEGDEECVMGQFILDCDPGHDDAVAILLAVQHLDVLGITTVSGNQSLDKVTRNALKVLELGGVTHVPVVPGFDQPLVEPVHHARSHGESGLDGAYLPDPSLRTHPGHAVDFIIDSVLAGGDVAIIAVGPLTNIAAALRREPRLRQRLSLISLMGGSLTFGNSTAAAEFNIWCDPEAAHIVFTSGVPIKMVGLNLTHQAIATPAELERMRALNNRTGTTLAQLLEFHCEQYRRGLGTAGAPLHDPCAVAWLIDPTLIEGRRLHVAVELHGEYTRGMTVCDYRHLLDMHLDIVGVEGIRKGSPVNAEVGLRLDTVRFFDLLMDTLGAYP
jgi:pyrimidine-specific ribonucleoside hydrolase